MDIINLLKTNDYVVDDKSIDICMNNQDILISINNDILNNNDNDNININVDIFEHELIKLIGNLCLYYPARKVY